MLGLCVFIDALAQRRAFNARSRNKSLTGRREPPGTALAPCEAYSVPTRHAFTWGEGDFYGIEKCTALLLCSSQEGRVRLGNYTCELARLLCRTCPTSLQNFADFSTEVFRLLYSAEKQDLFLR